MLWLCCFGVAQAEVVDGILYVIGDRIVTRSDIAFERACDPIDQGLAVLEDPTYPIEQRLVDFAILRELARDIDIYRPPDGEVRARWERFRSAWPHPGDHVAFLERWGIDDDQLMGFLYSRLVVERYVLRNAVGSQGGGEAALTSAEYQAWMQGLRARASVRVLQ
jgi:hypothetical protein